MDTQFGLKELYDVTLKATYSMEIEGKEIEPGDTIAVFDRIQISNFKEIKSLVTAHGGFDDSPRVFWESTKEVRLNFTQGIFSKIQLALMTNSNLIQQKPNEKVYLNTREELETDERGRFWLKHEPYGRVCVYEKKSGKKLFYIEQTAPVYETNRPFTELIVDYVFEYKEKTTRLVVGQRLTNGYLSLQGKTRVKDDVTGKVKTGIINIPKLKLMSELSMTLGEKANPLLGHLEAIACPTGTRNNPVVMELIFLNDDIDSDM